MSFEKRPTEILIAEDNPGDLRLIRLALAETPNWPVAISVAHDGEQAIRMLEANRSSDVPSPPDLLILDFNLPKRSGAFVLEAIRNSDQLRKMAVIILSSSPEYFLREKVREARADAACIFTKPSDFDEFVQLGMRFRSCYESHKAG